MKNIASTIALLGLLSSVAFTGCTDNKKNKQESATVNQPIGQDSAGLATAPKPKPLGRVASIEYRYSNDGACRQAATTYFNSVGGSGTVNDYKLPTLPLTYSFCDSENNKAPDAKELRFTVLAANPAQPVDTIKYYEIEKKTGSYKKDLEQAFRVMEREYQCDSLQGPTEDKSKVNGKRPWRALMHSKVPIDPFAKGLVGRISDNFGLVINPPYP